MSAIEFRGREAAWNQMFHVVRDQFPYSKMKGLAVKDGAVVSFREVQYTFVFGRGVEPPRSLLPDAFDEQWQRFMRFCQALQDGIVGEVHFTDGRPVLVLMQQAGMDMNVQAPMQSSNQGGEISEKHLVAA